MNAQEEVRKALSGFIEKFGLSTFGEFNVADLADLLVRLNDVERAIIHRIEVALDEEGKEFRKAFRIIDDFVEGYYRELPGDVPDEIEDALRVILREDGRTTPVFVKPGVTVKEVDLGVSLPKETEEVVPAFIPGENFYFTLKGFVEYATVRFSLNAGQAGEIRKIVNEAVVVRIRARGAKDCPVPPSVVLDLTDYVAVKTEKSRCPEGCPSGVVLLQPKDGQGRQFYLCECGFIGEVGVGTIREGGDSHRLR